MLTRTRICSQHYKNNSRLSTFLNRKGSGMAHHFYGLKYVELGKVLVRYSFLCANKSTSKTTGTVKAHIQYIIAWCCMQSEVTTYCEGN